VWRVPGSLFSSNTSSATLTARGNRRSVQAKGNAKRKPILTSFSLVLLLHGFAFRFLSDPPILVISEAFSPGFLCQRAVILFQNGSTLTAPRQTFHCQCEAMPSTVFCEVTSSLRKMLFLHMSNGRERRAGKEGVERKKRRKKKKWSFLFNAWRVL